MPKKYELTKLNKHPTDAEIMWAIRYLDPDLCLGKARKDPATVVGIGITLLTAITGALTYIGLWFHGRIS
jgi:hypothetical protein